MSAETIGKSEKSWQRVFPFVLHVRVIFVDIIIIIIKRF